MTGEFPQVPPSRIRRFLDGMGTRARTNLTVVVTVMVAVIMVLQAAIFVWAIRVNKLAEADREADRAARAQQLHDLAEAQLTALRDHRCRQEEVHDAIARKLGVDVPNNDPLAAPPECPHENRPPS